MPPKPVIAVCIPYRERLEKAFVTDTLIPLYEAQAKSSLVNTLKPHFWDNDTLLGLLEEGNPLKSFRLVVGSFLMDDMPFIPVSRNRLAEVAVGRGVDYIYWLDSDMRIFSPRSSVEALHMLYDASLEHDADLVSGMYLSKKDRKLCAYRWHEHKVQISLTVDEVPPEGVQVDAVGFGCLLMNTRVLGKLDFPWFTCNSVYDLPEDIGFCSRAGKAGFKIWLHGGVRFNHTGLFELSLEDEESEEKT